MWRLDFDVAELVEYFQEAPRTPGKAVERHYHQNVKLPPSSVTEHIVESRSSCLCPRNAIRVLCDNVELPLLRRLPQVIQLRLRMLIAR